jgi:group II intron reverse transcriptase/maturase
VSKAKKTANPGKLSWDLPKEGGAELRSTLGESSFASALSDEKDRITMDTSKLLERVIDRNNLNHAYKRVKRNGGSHGVDGMRVGELSAHLKRHGDQIRHDLLNGKYRPQPVRRVEIPKPDGGGVRLLGVPTVVDRMIQQAIAQILTPVFEAGFSDHSYGFRPGRSAHDAIKQAQVYLNEGYTTVVDIDLEKFFDRVNHDKIMYLLSRKILDKRLLRIIRRYLESGVMIGGLVSPSREGTPQGGPLSPMLSNVMLDELDKELEKRGHRFCRYADDCNIYVKSRRAGERVMSSITQFIEQRLKLKVNRDKSAVGYVGRRKFLGFSFYTARGEYRIRVDAKSIKRLKDKLRLLTSRSNSWSMEVRLYRLNQVICGWVNYFSLADMRNHCHILDEWLRRRLRMCHWKQWKKVKTKHGNLIRLGLPVGKAWEYANTRKGYWHSANSWILSSTLTNAYFEKAGLYSLSSVYYNLNLTNRRMPNGTYGGVRGQIGN